MKSRLPIVDLKKEPMTVSVVTRGRKVSFSDMPERLIPGLVDAFGREALDMVTGSSPAQHSFNLDLKPATRHRARFLELYESGELEARARRLGSGGRVPYFMAAINRSDETILGRTGVLYLVCRKGCHACQYRGFPERTLNAEELAARMLAFAREGADNVQWLSPTAFVPELVTALWLAAREGFKLPIVHKSEGEDPPDQLRVLDGLVDMYLPDIKFVRPEFAARVGLPESYAQRVGPCIEEMYRQVGVLKRRSDRGRLLQGGGLFVRHLLLPGGVEEAKAVLSYVYSIDPDLPAHVMTNYEPLHDALKIPGIDRRVTDEEIDQVVEHARTATYEMQVLFG